MGQPPILQTGVRSTGFDPDAVELLHFTNDAEQILGRFLGAEIVGMALVDAEGHPEPADGAVFPDEDERQNVLDLMRDGLRFRALPQDDLTKEDVAQIKADAAAYRRIIATTRRTAA